MAGNFTVDNSDQPIEGASPERNPARVRGTSDPKANARVALWKMRGYHPFEWQESVEQEVEDTAARYISLNIGRGAGKTTLLTELAWAGAVDEVNDGLGPPFVPVFADTYEHGMKIFDQILSEAASTMAPTVHHTDLDRHIVALRDYANPEKPGAIIQLLSADNPKAMTGHNKTTRSISDESQFIIDESWKQFKPNLNIRHAKHIAAGVAQGVGWFRTNSLRGFDTDEWPEYDTRRYDSRVNPYFTDEDWDLNKREYSLDDFTGLYEAKWTTGDGSVFENIDNCIINSSISLYLELGIPLILEEPKAGHEYIAGVDVAKARDFMAVLIADRWTGRVVAALRANKRTYSFLESLVADLLVRYGARTWIDETGAGAAVVEHLIAVTRQRYADMKAGDLPERRVAYFPEQLQTGRKMQVVDDLALAMIREGVRFPNIKALVSELRLFEKTNLPGGGVRMAAPAGLHDDLVIALALMAQGLPSPGAKPRGTNEDSSRRVGGWEKLK